MIINKEIKCFKELYEKTIIEYDDRKQLKRTHHKYWTIDKLKSRIDNNWKLSLGLKTFTSKQLRKKIKDLEFYLDYSISVNDNLVLKTRYKSDISRYRRELDDRRSNLSQYISLKECIRAINHI